MGSAFGAMGAYLRLPVKQERMMAEQDEPRSGIDADLAKTDAALREAVLDFMVEREIDYSAERADMLIALLNEVLGDAYGIELGSAD